MGQVRSPRRPPRPGYRSDRRRNSAPDHRFDGFGCPDRGQHTASRLFHRDWQASCVASRGTRQVWTPRVSADACIAAAGGLSFTDAENHPIQGKGGGPTHLQPIVRHAEGLPREGLLLNRNECGLRSYRSYPSLVSHRRVPPYPLRRSLGRWR